MPRNYWWPSPRLLAVKDLFERDSAAFVQRKQLAICFTKKGALVSIRQHCQLHSWRNLSKLIAGSNDQTVFKLKGLSGNRHSDWA